MRNRILFGIPAFLLLSVSLLPAQDATDGRRFSFHARVNFLETKDFTTSTVTSSTTKPTADYSTTGSFTSTRFTGGAGTEARVFGRFTLGLEVMFHPSEYKQVVSVKTGTFSGTTDTRVPSTFTETTRAHDWDFPLLVRYRGIRSAGIFSHIVPLGGVSLRHIGGIRTSNETSKSDGTTAYNEIPAMVAHRNSIGGVVGVGMRFVDPVGLKILPEVRFTKWQNPAFSGTAFRSTTNQIEIGLGIGF